MSKMSLTPRGASSASTSDVMVVQEAMQVAGLYFGSVDGDAGPKTYAAVRAYKKANHMPVNNALSEDFITHLRENA